jgi:N-acetylmuramoyl-L-alanine amidase
MRVSVPRDPPLTAVSRGSLSRLTVRIFAAAAVGSTLLVVHRLAGQTAPPPAPLTLLSRDGRRAIQVSLVGDQEFVALDDLAAVFQLAVREETLGAITVSYKTKTIVLTPDQALASVSGRLISLPAAPARSGRRWLVPVEFISRALAPIYDARLDLRKPSHLLIAGDLRVPRVTMRYDPAGASARLTIDIAPRATTTVSQENDRLSIKFDADALDVAMPQIQPQGLVQAVRLADAVTLAIDLGPRFASFRASTQSLDSSARLVVDFTATQSDVVLPPATTVPAPPPPTPAPDLGALSPDLNGLNQAASAIRTVAIDPGHGGDDQGAVGPGGTREKDLTLAAARRLKAAIEARLGIRVLLTREDDRNVPLDDRTAVANNNKADAFISLHASGSPRSGNAGASILFAAFDKEEADAARAAQALGSASGGRLPTFAGGSRDIELVLWDLAQTRYVEQSGELARILQEHLRDRVPLAPRAVDQAPLRVLESANMPAVLIEIGYLSNPNQEKQLISNEFQSAFVQSVVDAVVKFRDALDAGRRAGGTP